MKQFDAVIFDLGGVIINLDYQKTIDAFVKLGMKDFDAVYTQMNQTSDEEGYDMKLQISGFEVGLNGTF